MFSNSDFELAFCLSYVLLVTDFASKHIHQILGSAVAYMIFLIRPFCICTGEIFMFVEYLWDRTISVVADCLFRDDSRAVFDRRDRGQFGPD